MRLVTDEDLESTAKELRKLPVGRFGEMRWEAAIITNSPDLWSYITDDVLLDPSIPGAEDGNAYIRKFLGYIITPIYLACGESLPIVTAKDIHATIVNYDLQHVLELDQLRLVGSRIEVFMAFRHIEWGKSFLGSFNHAASLFSLREMAGICISVASLVRVCVPPSAVSGRLAPLESKSSTSKESGAGETHEELVDGEDSELGLIVPKVKGRNQENQHHPHNLTFTEYDRRVLKSLGVCIDESDFGKNPVASNL